MNKQYDVQPLLGQNDGRNDYRDAIRGALEVGSMVPHPISAIPSAMLTAADVYDMHNAGRYDIPQLATDVVGLGASLVGSGSLLKAKRVADASKDLARTAKMGPNLLSPERKAMDAYNSGKGSAERAMKEFAYDAEMAKLLPSTANDINDWKNILANDYRKMGYEYPKDMANSKINAIVGKTAKMDDASAMALAKLERGDLSAQLSRYDQPPAIMDEWMDKLRYDIKRNQASMPAYPVATDAASMMMQSFPLIERESH